ncbi:DNA (cytosine-5-)-methyltransferase [Salinibacter grassmerensis]|uniref:DNA (cytosine-5-)-methyltransferase n=1 Tax=Salinibacter grassmerensis TaxID=3040353 RepID=UPI0021E99AF9|nr:DNA (cytosine-5-)-methyltransferase [Salinibacter grassmerensis]
MNEPVALIDLFSGCGGFTLGFTQVHTDEGNPVFEPVWSNDFDEDSVASYNSNFGDHCVHGNIVDLLEEGVEFPDADIVIGGPPCQGYSLLNKDKEGDPRKQLWRPYMEVVDRVGAEVFVMENVQQLLGSAEHDDIKARARELGFEVESADLVAANYGVPQTRTRAFIIGSKLGDPAEHFPPERTHFNPKERQMTIDDGAEMQPWNTVRDAIGDLPPPLGTEVRDEPGPFDLHFSRSPTAKSIRRYITVQEEGANRYDLQERAPEITPDCWKRKTSGGTDIFGRLWWDRPAFTIRTEFFKPEKGRSLHPSQHRAITHREAARFQSFPDWFDFQGSKTSIASQIGNAVPPRLGFHVATSAARLFTDEDLTRREDPIGVHSGTNGSIKSNGEMSKEDIQKLCNRLVERAEEVDSDLSGDELRESTQALADAKEAIKEIGKSLFPDATSGRKRILKYLLSFPRTPIPGKELGAVAGIKEYGRRIRELRKEHGWPVYSGITIREMIYEGDLFEPDVPDGAKEMARDDYILLDTERDEEAAERWKTANKIRNMDGSLQDRLLKFFRENVGEPVTGEELRYVANGAQSWPRRVRELRTEEGWPVRTRNTGRPDLEQGEYILEEDRQDEPHDRDVQDMVRSKVLDRDGHECRKCGWDYVRGEKNPHGPRTKLEVHHTRPHVEGGENNADNLVTLCNVCHDEVHRTNRLEDPDELQDWLTV